MCTETRSYGAVSDTIYDSFSLPRRLAVVVHSPTLLGQLSISFIPAGKLRNIFQSHVGFGARVLAFSLGKAPTPVPKNPSVHAYLLLLCVRKCACGSSGHVIQICHVL